MSNDELLTIKMLYNCEMKKKTKRYTGGCLAYVNFCDSEVSSLIEINSMITEYRSKGGY